MFCDYILGDVKSQLTDSNVNVGNAGDPHISGDTLIVPDCSAKKILFYKLDG